MSPETTQATAKDPPIEASRTHERQAERTNFRWQNRSIPPNLINTLTQPRKTFDELDSLAANIDEHGLMYRLLIAGLDEENCRAFIETHNRAWKKDCQLSDLTPTYVRDKVVYYILIAGERRFRSMRDILHLSKVPCSVAYNIPFEKAIKLQFSENIHVEVPPDEEAQALNYVWPLTKALEPEYTLEQFARDVGRSQERVRRALRFCRLPQDIQDAITETKETKSRRTRYALVCELVRSYEAIGFGEDELRGRATSILYANSLKVEEYRRKVTQEIFNFRNGQRDMLGLFEANQEALERIMAIRRPLARNLLPFFWQAHHFTNEAIKALEAGKLSFDKRVHSPFSPHSPKRIIEATHVLERDKLLPHLRGFGEEEIAINQFLGAAEQFGELAQILKTPDDDSFLSNPDDPYSELCLVNAFLNLLDAQRNLLPYCSHFMNPEEIEEAQNVCQELQEHLGRLKERMLTESRLNGKNSGVVYQSAD